MHSGELTPDFSPGPILDALSEYQGSIVDLDQSLTVDAGSLHRSIDYLRWQLSAAGLSGGDRVVVAVANGPRFIAILAAVLRRGGTPLLVHFKTPPAELQRLAHRWGAQFIISDSHQASDLQPVTRRARTYSDDGWVRLAFAWVDTDHADFQDSYPTLPGVPLHPTSGTTGQPKIAVRPGPCAVAEARHYIDTTGIAADDTILAVPPMSHAYAYGMCVMVPLLSGANIVTTRQFNAASVMRAMTGGGVTVFPAVPAMLDMLLITGGCLQKPPRYVFSAGAPLAARTAAAFERKCGVRVRPLYGTTETGGITIAISDTRELTPGCVGETLVDVSACVREAAAPLGTLHVNSASMMAGYLAPGGIDNTSIDNGWFDTGDLATIDEVGAIHLKGRQTEMINVAGMKVVPSEVEEILAAMPGVRETKVYAGRLGSGDQFVKAAIVANGVTDPSRFRAHCEQNLVYYKRPSRYVFVESLPKTPSGKIILDRLP